MGSGVSVHNKNPKSDSAMKFRLSSTASFKAKEKPLNNQEPFPYIGGRCTGSREDTFFDSQAWLESDCEDDFVSVNGDFTPSRGSTSSRRFSFNESPRLSQSYLRDKTSDLKSETSPTERKKKLSELLRDSLGGDEDYTPQNKVNDSKEARPTNVAVISKSANGTPSLSKSNSVRSSEKTPNKYSKSEKEKLGKTSQCCLPSLVSSLSFSERKRKLSPGRRGAE